MSPLHLCVETVSSISLGAQSSLSVSRVLTQGLLGGGISCTVDGGWLAWSPGPSAHFPIGSQASLIRAEDNGGVCALKILGTLYLCEQGLLLSSAQRA